MRRCFFVFWVLALAVRAQEPPRYDFLFVVDTSISMAEHKQRIISDLRTLIHRKFSGQIEPGDSLDIWTFDSEDRLTRAPSQIWDNDDKEALADWAATTVRAEKFHRGSHLGPVLADVNEFVTRATAALIILFTDADEQIAGFDLAEEINKHSTKLRQTARRAKQPVVYVMLAHHGRLVDWRAYAGAETTPVLRVPARPKPQPAVEPALVVATKPEKEETVPPPSLPSFVYPPGTKIYPASAAKLPETETSSDNSPPVAQAQQPPLITEVSPLPDPVEPSVHPPKAVASTEQGATLVTSTPAARPSADLAVTASERTRTPTALPTTLPVLAALPSVPTVDLQITSPQKPLQSPSLTVAASSESSLLHVLIGLGGTATLLLGATMLLRNRPAPQNRSIISQSLGK